MMLKRLSTVVLPLLLLVAPASSGALPVGGVITANPQPGISISGTLGGHAIKFVVSHTGTKVRVALRCAGRSQEDLPVRNGRFATTAAGFKHFGWKVSGHFTTPKSLRARLGLSLGLTSHCHVVRSTTGTLATGKPGLKLTQCPVNDRQHPLTPNTPFTVKGVLWPPAAGEVLKLVFETLSPARPIVLARTAEDGTFSARFTVPGTAGNATEAGVIATANHFSADCLFTIS